jgi:predicted  nucleic acid-binding Zn-ribbon protein
MIRNKMFTKSHLLKLIDEIQKENNQLKSEISNLVDTIEALRDENLTLAVRLEEVNRQAISNETALWNADTKNQELLKDLNDLTVEFENERLQKLNKAKELENKNSKLQCELIDSANKVCFV